MFLQRQRRRRFKHACPVEAIFYEDNVPAGWRDYIALNAEMAPLCPVITERKEPLAAG